jgi:hypothetical protein
VFFLRYNKAKASLPPDELFSPRESCEPAYLFTKKGYMSFWRKREDKTRY